MHIMGRQKAKQASDQSYKEYMLAPQRMKMSCLKEMTIMKFKSMPSMHIHRSTATRLKTLFSFVVCNRKPYDVIFFYVPMLEVLIRGVLYGDVINIIFMQI
jgi:hypothetical protein